MATVPPKFRRATDAVLEIFRPSTAPLAPRLTEEQERVALWLRGQQEMFDSLEQLLRERIEERGRLPVPSTPEILATEAGRNKEAREIIEELRGILHAPAPSLGSEE